MYYSLPKNSDDTRVGNRPALVKINEDGTQTTNVLGLPSTIPN